MNLKVKDFVDRVIMNVNKEEKSPFLSGQKPVSLTPSWEAQKLPNDELNFKGLTMAKAQMTLTPPKDKFKLVFLIFLLHGLGTLMPWNMFITAKSILNWRQQMIRPRQYRTMDTSFMANGIYQNTIYGMAATLPVEYTGAVVLGANISGLFTTIVSICSSFVFSSYRTSAIYYFITAMLVLLMCFDTYFALPLNKFYRYHEMIRRKDNVRTDQRVPIKIPYGSVFFQAFPQLFNIFFVFFVTLAVFPAVHSDIRPNHTNFFIPDQLFTSITCFLTFNLFAMLGSLATSWVQWPKPKYLWIPVSMRGAFLPLFLFCNYLPKGAQRTLPILITNEWIYWIIAVVMSFSSGYLSSLGMMYAPKTVSPKYQTTAGMFAAAMLITGIFSGILFSFLFPYFYFVDFKLATNDTFPTTYAGCFLQYMSFASQIPNLIFNWINIFLRIGGDITKRIVCTIPMILIIFIFTVILAMVDSSSWPDIFFWITIITIVILQSVNGVYHNTVYGMAAILPLGYTGAVVLGSNLSGLFAAIASICSSYIFSSHRTAAIYYFLTAILVFFICFDTYFALPLNKFYRYHEIVRRKENLRKVEEEIGTRIPYLTIFIAALPQLCNVFFTLFVTLSVFPAVHSGNLTTTIVQWPKPKYLRIFVLMRCIFVPLFLFCNYLPKGVERKLPVLITNEWIYWIIAVVMSYSSGYLQSLGMMYAPKTVAPKYQTTAGMFTAAMLISGVFAGILLSFLFPYIV
uniref:Equilibrative nucleoside transporter 1 n=1 Tax=Glossina pallidipes TaxID=7398 RepID=A0A1B0AHH1_GLOPL